MAFATAPGAHSERTTFDPRESFMHSHRSSLAHKLRIGAVTLLVGSAGAATAVTAASGKGGRDHPEDSTTGTTSGTPRAPRITDIEVDRLGGGRLRLRTEVAPRGASVTSVRIRYRGTTYKARRTAGTHWARTVDARGGDGRDSVITLRVTACAGSTGRLSSSRATVFPSANCNH
jgi:hypothetical protein